ncbi:MAG: hypothetical protein IKT10_02975 [Clostridiales bacterium]|nr:hypothetical protein [Clostridiales bacterium]
MKKVFALILCLSMMLGIASCAKKVEVPSKSDVKKAAKEEYDMDFKVDSEDISDDEKDAEWVLISKDGTLEVTVTWNSKDPEKFEFDDKTLEEPTTTTTTEEPTTTTTEEPTTTTTTADSSTPDSSDNGGSTPNPNPTGAKYINFDEMNFYINGKKFTLGKTTLQDMIDAGVPFKEGELEDAKNNLKSNYQSAPIKLDIGKGFTASVYVFNDTGSGKPMNECFVNEITYYGSYTKGATQNVLSFDFPLNVTIEDLKANSGDPTEDPYHNEEDPKFIADYLEWTKKGTKYMNRNRYRFEFYNYELRNVSISFYP